MAVLLAISVLANIVLALLYRAARWDLRGLHEYMDAKEQHRSRVARALVDRFRYLEKAHQKDYDNLAPLVGITSKQGEAARIMRGGFNGLVKAYGNAADDVQQFIVWEANTGELLKEAAELEARNG